MKIKTIALAIIITIANNSQAQNLPLSLPIPASQPKGLPADNVNVLMKAPELNITQPKMTDGNNFQFNNINLNNLLSIVFGEVMSKNYVLSPEIMQDQRQVSFRYSKKKDGDIEPFITTFLKGLGYNVNNKSGVLYVEKTEQKKPEDYFYYIYNPKYRTANYLADSLRPFFPDFFLSSNRQIQTDQRSTAQTNDPTSALAMIDKEQEALIFKYENDKQKDKILSFLNQVDIEEKNIIVKAYIYEVSYNSNDGSAFGLMLNLANSKLKLQLGATSPLDNFVKFSSNTLQLFLSNIDTDNRVKLVSNPVLRLRNNKTSSFVVGESVPTLGNITTTNNTTQQSVNYVDTGLTFKITPTITKKNIDLDLTEEISGATNTTTGVNNSPTLQKRNLTSSFSTKENEVIMLAGLTQNKLTNNESVPFILPFWKQKNSQYEKTDIVIFLQVLPATDEKSLPEDLAS
ncbi:type II secretion system protein GspD [Burkholderia multivorans]|uniref:type II secretion system protein GspD n=1 Tax=Burkholderia multivorans TaxID=87883 RepID=UPI001C278BF7|nr:hypothetical protein [Burkholderia multivorans]MBU9542859.1 hypothetical protein [Burkholderia multivorans]